MDNSEFLSPAFFNASENDAITFPVNFPDAELPAVYGQDDEESHSDHASEGWYEQRKTSLILAALPKAIYTNAFEARCGTGALTVALANRCQTITATDCSSSAVQLALQRSFGLDNVNIIHQVVPTSWTVSDGQCFDLIVINEFANCLSDVELSRLADHCSASLAPGGHLVACHWRPPFEERRQSAEHVHSVFEALPDMAPLMRHEEADFLLDVWSRDWRSVAESEGLR